MSHGIDWKNVTCGQNGVFPLSSNSFVRCWSSITICFSKEDVPMPSFLKTPRENFLRSCHTWPLLTVTPIWQKIESKGCHNYAFTYCPYFCRARCGELLWIQHVQGLPKSAPWRNIMIKNISHKFVSKFTVRQLFSILHHVHWLPLKHQTLSIMDGNLI